jgi:multicomponent Na+:H+ antiporter subunit C
MSTTDVFGVCAALLVGLGLYGLIVNPQPLRKLLAFNLMGNGIFLVAAVIARRGAAAGLGGDPVPQALLITAIVVAFAASALAVALMLRLFEETGACSLTSSEDPLPVRPSADGGG